MSWNTDILASFDDYGSEVFIGNYTIFTNPRGVRLGRRVRIDPFCLITTDLVTDDNVQICSHAVLGGGAQHTIRLGHWSFIGYGSKLFCGSEDYSGDDGPVNDFWGKNKVFHGDISIKDFAGVASDVIVMPGVTIPEGCTVGAKSFVYSSKQLEPWTVYIGNPLKMHKRRNEAMIRELADTPTFWKYPR